MAFRARCVTGSVGQMGHLDVTFYVRDSGVHVRALKVVGKAGHDGRLTLTVFQASVPLWRATFR